jgi:hypothetical protein
MTSTHRQNLLRRTAVALATLAVSLAALPAAALTVTLSDTTGSGTCTFNGMSVDPAGNVTVTCTSGFTGTGSGTGPGTVPPTGPGVFSVVLASATMPAPAAGTTSPNSFTITRSGGTTGAVTVPFSVTGGACLNGSTIIPFTDGQTVSNTPNGGPVPLTIVAAGTCTVSLGTPTSGSLGTARATISVGSPGGTTPPTGSGTNPPGIPIVSGCPAAASGTQMAVLPVPNGPSILSRTAASDQITSFPMYPLSQYNRTSAQASFGQTPAANSPAPATINVSISPCPGVIDPTLNDACNIRGITITNGVTFGWATQQSIARANLECYAPEGTQMYYNVSWHYNPGACSNGAPTCGWSVNVN